MRRNGPSAIKRSRDPRTYKRTDIDDACGTTIPEPQRPGEIGVDLRLFFKRGPRKRRRCRLVPPNRPPQSLTKISISFGWFPTQTRSRRILIGGPAKQSLFVARQIVTHRRQRQLNSRRLRTTRDLKPMPLATSITKSNAPFAFVHLKGSLSSNA